MDERRTGPAPGLRARFSRLSLRSRLVAVFVASAVVVVVIAGLCAASVNNVVTARHVILGEVDPASLLANQLELTYINQENSVRGYVLSQGDSSYLHSYRSYRAAQAAATRLLASHLAADPMLSDLLHRIEVQGTDWQAHFAEPTVRAVQSDGHTTISDAQLKRGGELFSEVRHSLTSLDRALSTRRTNSGDRLASATVTLIVVMVIGLGLILLGGWALWRCMQAWVLAPVSSLASDARQVSVGALSHRIMPTGPPELVLLGSDVEAMRQRIVDELSTVADARAELDARNLELARSNRELEQFAYVASHDLQEPLRKVTSFTQLLQQRYGDTLDERAHQYIEFAVDGATRMQTLINDLLLLSRAGQTTEHFVDVDIEVAVSGALHNLASALEESDGRVDIGPLPHVTGDPVLLTQVWQNLIGNSLKFRGEEPPVVRVSAERRADDWLFAVADNGIGIDPRFSEKVFVIFQRLHGRETFGGTGIGLALCKKIVEFHGGRIWVDETYHPGTNVQFTLPDRTGGE